MSKSATAFGKIGRSFWDKATTALGKTGRERFFLRRRVLQNRSGALPQIIHAMFTDVGSTTRNWFGCFMFSLSKINLKKSIKGWARWRRRPSSSLKLCLF